MDLTQEIRRAEAYLERLKSELAEQNMPLDPFVVRSIQSAQNDEILALKTTVNIVVGILHEKFPDLARSAKLPISIQDLPY